jgi:hypothetical protein
MVSAFSQLPSLKHFHYSSQNFSPNDYKILTFFYFNNTSTTSNSLFFSSFYLNINFLLLQFLSPLRHFFFFFFNLRKHSNQSKYQWSHRNPNPNHGNTTKIKSIQNHWSHREIPNKHHKISPDHLLH